MDDLRRRLAVSESVEEGENYVDLGLPSRTLWAKGNIVPDRKGGYKIGKETDYGAYVSWGNIVPHFSSNGSTFDDNYDWGSSSSGAPYKNTPGAKLNSNVPLNATYDAALALLGEPWHLPTQSDFAELKNNTDAEQVTINGVVGWKFMKKTDHSVYVFFPSAGNGSNSTVTNRSVAGYYWSSSRYDSTKGRILYLKTSVSADTNFNKYLGVSVRAIKYSTLNITITLTPVTLGLSVSDIPITITDSKGTRYNVTTDAQGLVAINNFVCGLATVSCDCGDVYTVDTGTNNITISENSKNIDLYYIEYGVYAAYSDTIKTYEYADTNAYGVRIYTMYYGYYISFTIEKNVTNGDNPVKFGGYGCDLKTACSVIDWSISTNSLKLQQGDSITLGLVNDLSGYIDSVGTVGIPPAQLCYTYGNGVESWLGSYREWDFVYIYLTLINNMLNKIGGIPLSGCYWTCAPYSDDITEKTYIFDVSGSNDTTDSNYYLRPAGRNESYRVRTFRHH